MCVVIPAAAMAAISTVSTIASTALSIRGQQIQRKTQAAVQERATIAANQQNAARMSAIRARQNQEAMVVSQQIHDQSRRAIEAGATARAAADVGGVTGTNVDALLADFTRKYADFRFASHQQQGMADHNRELAMSDAGNQFQQTWIDINRPLQQVDYAGAAVGLGQNLSGVSRTYARDLRIQRQQEGMGRA